MKAAVEKPTIVSSGPKVPAALQQALDANPQAMSIWVNITPVARRDWITWIESAKKAETHQIRIEKTISKLSTGMRRPCCYAVVPMDLYKALGKNAAAKKQWSALSADEKRDFADWVDGAPKGEKKGRVEEACALLVAGKRQPQ